MATAVHTTAPSLSEARRIARALAEARRWGCGRIEPAAQGAEDPEIRLIVKCADEAGAEVIRLIRENHTYAEPRIWTETVEAGASDFLRWVEERSRGPQRR